MQQKMYKVSYYSIEKHMDVVEILSEQEYQHNVYGLGKSYMTAVPFYI